MSQRGREALWAKEKCEKAPISLERKPFHGVMTAREAFCAGDRIDDLGSAVPIYMSREREDEIKRNIKRVALGRKCLKCSNFVRVNRFISGDRLCIIHKREARNTPVNIEPTTHQTSELTESQPGRGQNPSMPSGRDPASGPKSDVVVRRGALSRVVLSGGPGL